MGENAMTEDQRVMYDNVGEVRNSDAVMRWSVAQVFLLIHSGLFTVFMTRLAEDMIVRIFMCLAGAVLGLLWLLITDRTQELLTYWNGRLRAFEEAEPHAIYVFGGLQYQALQTRRITTYRILLALIIFIIWMWSITFLVFVSFMMKRFSF